MMKALSEAIREDKLYKLDPKNHELLIESAPLSVTWAGICRSKETGGMEEWAKGQETPDVGDVESCDWYHGTWQLLRLLNMVAVPPWYAFYKRALTSVLRRRPNANILIAAAADYGMLATLHEGIEAAGATPKITIYDICETPLLSCQWYAERHGLEVECVCDNILTSSEMPLATFDLIVTDEFLTVIGDEDKPAVVRRWKELLVPGGTVVTTVMVGDPTTPELRAGYAARARRLLKENAGILDQIGMSEDELVARFDRFAEYHTRHMIKDENEVRRLFGEDFYLGFLSLVPTPGECVNPTYSFQIVASLPYLRPA